MRCRNAHPSHLKYLEYAARPHRQPSKCSPRHFRCHYACEYPNFFQVFPMQSLLILFHKSHGAKRRHLYHIEQASVRLPLRPLLDFPVRRPDWIYSHRKNARRQISLRALAPQYGQSIGGSHLYFLQAKYPAPSLHENHVFCPPSKRLRCWHLRLLPKHHRFQQSDRPVWSSQRR